MSSKPLNLSQSVQALCSQYPELLDVLKEIGFRDIAIPGMLNTVGRIMTIPKGATMRKMDMALIISRLEQAGFELIEA